MYAKHVDCYHLTSATANRKNAQMIIKHDTLNNLDTAKHTSLIQQSTIIMHADTSFLATSVNLLCKVYCTAISRGKASKPHAQ